MYLLRNYQQFLPLLPTNINIRRASGYHCLPSPHLDNPPSNTRMAPAKSHKNNSNPKEEDSTELKRINMEHVPHHFCSAWRPDSFDDSSDFVIVVQGKRYPAHKCILSTASPVFKAMISNDMKESQRNEVDLQSIQKASWWLIYRFIYTGNIEIKNEATCLDILLFAHQYEMELLLRKAEIVLVEYITSENAIERLLLADNLGLQILRKDCIEVVGGKFAAIRKYPAFKNLPFRIIDEILSDTDGDEPIGSLPPWKIAEAEHLLTHLDFTLIRQEGTNGTVSTLANHPAISSYPGLVLNLLRHPTKNTYSCQGHNKRKNKRRNLRSYCANCDY